MSGAIPRDEGSTYGERGERRIGRYRLLGLLATGGMAEVYLALAGELSGFRTLVVVKRILPQLASNRHFIDMFIDEARIAARLDHPNIARILEVGHDSDEYFLAMELVQGRPLSALLRRAMKQGKPLPHAEAAFLVAQAANGLAHAHDLVDAEGGPLELVHRDVSPQNILVSFEGVVKVIDFGVARALGRMSETVSGELKGKIHYMSPEQVEGRAVDRRSDVFALGIVLWEALCGRRLYRRDSEVDTMTAIVREEVPRPSRLVAIPPRLEAVVMRALRKNPGARFQTARELALALERHAFASSDFRPEQIGARMKTLFAADHARWRRTVAATARAEASSGPWRDTSGTFLRPQEITVPLRGPHRDHDPLLLTSSREVSSDGAGSSSDDLEWLLPPLPQPTPPVTRAGPTRLRRTVALAAGLILGLAAAGAWSALARRGPGALLASPAPTPVSRGVAVVKPLPPPLAAAPATPAPEVTRQGEPAGATDVRPASPPGEAPRGPPGSHRPRKPLERVEKVSHHPHSRGARGRAAEPSGAECSVRLGSQPWAEVLIDGRTTNKHTPYSELISCGSHQITFVRRDRGIDKTISIVVHAGPPLKKTVALGAP